jgi:Ca2+-binding RTX toxin-like protein
MKCTVILVLTVAALMVAVSGAAFAVTLTGTGGDDSLKGSDEADTLYARGGSDSVFGCSRDDKLSGEGDADGL